jgi:oxysterol-binding protein-related protein 9/10/11
MYTTPSTSPMTPTTPVAPSGPSETASVKSGKSSKSGLSFNSKNGKSPSTAPTSPQVVETNVEAQISNLSLGEGDNGSRVRVVYVTEQVSHHPPVSAYYGVCPSRNLEFAGVDQISAKVSGTSVRVSPGPFNKGIYLKITGGSGMGEVYNITHPVAHVNGILRGSFYVTVGDTTIITCTGGKGDVNSRYRAILEYKEEVSVSFSLSVNSAFMTCRSPG